MRNQRDELNSIANETDHIGTVGDSCAERRIPDAKTDLVPTFLPPSRLTQFLKGRDQHTHTHTHTHTLTHRHIRRVGLARSFPFCHFAIHISGRTYAPWRQGPSVYVCVCTRTLDVTRLTAEIKTWFYSCPCMYVIENLYRLSAHTPKIFIYKWITMTQIIIKRETKVKILPTFTLTMH